MSPLSWSLEAVVFDALLAVIALIILSVVAALVVSGQISDEEGDGFGE